MYSFYSHISHDMLPGYFNIPNDNPGFEDLLATIAAEHFPLSDGKSMHEKYSPISALSPISSSSGNPSSVLSPQADDHDVENTSDPDSDVKGLILHPIRSDDQYIQPPDSDEPYIPVSKSRNRNEKRSRRQRKQALKIATHPPPVIVSTSSRRLISNPSNSSLFSDTDPELEEDESNATEDEYIPSPVLAPRKRRRRARSVSGRRQARVLGGLSTSLNDADHVPSKRLRLSLPSRNRQSASPVAIELAAELPNPDFTCPECGWKQTNQRMPDFQRHLRTHTRPNDQDRSRGWWCKGVRLEEAADYGLPRTLEPYLFLGIWRVGGCQRTFARRDALKRHLDNQNIPCVGRPVDLAISPARS